MVLKPGSDRETRSRWSAEDEARKVPARPGRHDHQHGTRQSAHRRIKTSKFYIGCRPVASWPNAAKEKADWTHSRDQDPGGPKPQQSCLDRVWAWRLGSVIGVRIAVARGPSQWAARTDCSRRVVMENKMRDLRGRGRRLD